MHSSIALLLPALSLLAASPAAQAWSPFSSSENVIVKRANPDLGIQTFYGNVGSGYATFVGCDGNGNYVAGTYSTPISYGLYPVLQASCDDQTDTCNAGALAAPGYSYLDCLLQATNCRNNQYLAVAKFGTTNVCPQSPAVVSAISVSSVKSVSALSTASVASVGSISAKSTASVASVASVSLKSAATTASIASVASASVASVGSVAATSIAAASAASVSNAGVASASSASVSSASVASVSSASVLSVSKASAASVSAQSVSSTISAQAVAASQSQASMASVSSVGVQSALSVASVVSSQAAAAAQSQSALVSISLAGVQSALSVASVASSQAAAAAQSQSALVSISLVGVQSALSVASTASVQAAAAAQSQSAIVSQVAQSSVAAVSRASVSALSVSSTISAAAAAAASTQASLASVSAVAAQSLLSVASTASAQVAAAAQSQAALASQSSLAVQSLASIQSQAAAASQSLLAVASQSNLAVSSALSIASIASVKAASASQSAQSTLSIASIASVSRISVSAAAASASAAAAALVLPAGYKAASTQLINEGANGARALAGASTSSDSMTPSVCALYCTKAGFAISGTEYGSECYCSNTLDNSASLTSISTSSAYPCSGAATQVCGGFSALSIAYNTALATLTNNTFTLIAVPVALPAGVSSASSSLISEGPNGRALTGPSTDLPSMTPTVCSTFCTAAGYAISGTEYSTQCFCGNALSNGASLSLVSTASAMACGGAAAQTCGAISALSVAYNTALASLSNGVFTILKAATVILPSGYKSASASLIGEGPSGRALTGAATSSSKMTPTLCAQYCTAASFAISGTEYSSECYCGNSFSNGASLSLTSANSAMPCSGDATQTCGAGSAMSVVYNTALATLSNGVFIITTSPTVPTIILPSGYKSASSSLIAEGPTGRAFAGAATSSSKMTPTVCAQYCTAAGFAISATEYSSECYCGNSFSNGGSLSLTSSNSPMACSGDASQTCGAASAMSVAYNTALATLTNGVFALIASTTTPTTATIILPAGYKSATSSLIAEGASGRSLSGASKSSSDMTPSVCAVYCTNAGYAISGTEWYTECYCGNSLSNGASLSLVSTSSKTACGGDATQTCGGASALSIVYNTALASLTNGVLTLTTQATLPTGWAVNTLGSGSCVAEPASGRALSSASYEAADMTIEKCLSFCDKGKYPFAGLEYSTQCFCGTSNSATASSTACNMPCGGASSETCGGPNAVSVYYSSSNLAAVPTPVATTAVTLTNGFTSTLTCWSEVDGRLMKGAGFTSDVMTYDLCTNYCSGAGFTQAGVEWGRECYCSSTVDLTKLVKNDNCNVACSGASSKICGGPQALQIFTTTAAADPTITLPNGWATDQSCLAEISARLLTAASMADPAMTPTMCTNFCSSKGATQAGVEYGTECYCGTGVNLKTAAKATNCDMACAGDQTTECGGSNALNVYTKASTVSRRRFRHRS